MPNMYATKKNFKVVHKIIELMYLEGVSIEQSCAILDYVKNKIAQDTVVGKLKPVDMTNLDEGF